MPGLGKGLTLIKTVLTPGFSALILKFDTVKLNILNKFGFVTVL